MHATLTMIKTATGKTFVPISVSHSPVKPDSEFIIVFRTSENVQAFSLQGWFVDNIPQLVKKFVTKTIKLDANFNPSTYQVKLSKQL